MGIAISELLTLEYFRDFRVLAGNRGLQREVQGVTVIDAPDSFRWTRGKELILSSGYVFLKEPECVIKWMREGYLTQAACVAIKAGRYLTPIPEELIRVFEECGMPLLEAPFSVAYMDVMHQVNVAMMNNTTKRFCILGRDTYSLGDDSYKERKLRQILQAVEAEMKFPALLHDISEDREYTSSVNLRRIADAHHLKADDFWEPQFPHTRNTLCDSLNMVRYRIQEEDTAKPRFSWITVPIAFAGSVQAYFVVIESRELIDYYDEYAIRIATLLLQSVYEQLIVARNMGNIGFENLIHYAMRCGADGTGELLTRADTLNFNINEPYFFAVMKQEAPQLLFSDHRESVSDELRLSFPGATVHFAFLQPDECLLMFCCRPANRRAQSIKEKDLCERIEALSLRLGKRLPGSSLRFGYFDHSGTLQDAARNIERCRQALRLGKTLYPTKHIFRYGEFGPLAWLQLSEDEMEMMCGEYRPLLSDPKGGELLRTLKTYLASNMSYSDTAKALYVNINTVRKRIAQVDELLDIQWDDTFTRMKLELLLQLLHV